MEHYVFPFVGKPLAWSEYQTVGFGNENFFSDLDGLAGQSGQR